jgi:hypothetical protein
MGRHLSLSPSSPTKSFVVEVHAPDPTSYLEDLVGQSNVEPTADAYLFRAHTEHGTFWVDQLDERFWTFHTDMPTEQAYGFLRDHVEARRELDWMWLPSEHLRHVWPGAVSRQVRTDFKGGQYIGKTTAARELKVQLSGQDADRLLDLIASDSRYRAAVSFDSIQTSVMEPEIGQISEAVNRMGRFAVSGDSLELHLLLVGAVVQRYRQLVELCEHRSITWQTFNGSGYETGGTVTGGPLVIELSRPVEDLNGFVDDLFSARRPFRLWGVPQLAGDTVEVEAVDLHVGQRLRMDLGRDWIRIYLEAGSCGNTVARLVSNLQHRLDGALRLKDPQLDAAVMARAPGAGGGGQA